MIRQFVCTASILVSISVLAPACGDRDAPDLVERPAATRSGKGSKDLAEPSLDHQRIGVLASRRLGNEEWEELAKHSGLRLSQVLDARLALFGIDQGLDRRQLVDLAQQIEERDPRRIAQAGAIELDHERPLRITTDEVVAEFGDDVSYQEIDELARSLGGRITFESPYVKHQFLIELDKGSPADAWQASAVFQQKGARFAHPNYVLILEPRETIPADAQFVEQWHHRNTGAGGGTVDADIDSTLAWDLVAGTTQHPLVAVLEVAGMSVTHPDYVANVADAKNFTDCDLPSPPPICQTSTLDVDPHGTAVMGTVAAEADGSRGVVGGCPSCKLLAIQLGYTAESTVLAIDYARTQGAAILNNSWGGKGLPTSVIDAIDRATTLGRGGLGAIVLFAMETTGAGYFENCLGPDPDISAARPDVIAVSASNDRDERTPAGYGDCLDVLAPTDGIGTASTQWPASTDDVGPDGYNSAQPLPGCTEVADTDYTRCFGGTSFSVAQVAGIAGLLLQSDPTLTHTDVERLVRDTADKIDPSVAAYDRVNGFSRPTAAPPGATDVGSTHGYGRVNAFEAARVAAGAAAHGHGGIDLFMRDNELDWGNTEQPSSVKLDPVRGWLPHYTSVDIKIDAAPFAPAPTATTFDSFVDEDAQAGVENRVYVRVRNRGPRAATGVTVRLYLAFAGTALPALPPSFWPTFPGPLATTTWSSVPALAGSPATLTVPYSGASIAGTPTDGAQIAGFSFVGPPVDSRPENQHHCLFALVDSAADPISTASRASNNVDFLVPRDNNATQRNIRVLPATSDRVVDGFYAANPTNRRMWVQLTANLPRGWKVESQPPLNQPFFLEAGRRIAVRLTIYRNRGNDAVGNEVQIVQERLDGEKDDRIMGGISYRFAARTDKQ